MPRPTPLPIRQAAFRLWGQGLRPLPDRRVAGAPGLDGSAIGRDVSSRAAGIPPVIRSPPPTRPSSPRPSGPPCDFAASIPLGRRPDPRPPAPGHARAARPVGAGDPTVVRQGGPRPAPSGDVGRGTARARATPPHETWQMDAKERIRLRGPEQVSWLRLTDECSGAMLWTEVFPPGCWGLVPPAAVREQLRLAFAAGACRDASASTTARPGARRATSRPSCRLADRPGDRDALEFPEEPPGERRGRTLAGDVEPLVRARTCATAEELQTRLDRMDRLHREVYPYREGLSRMAYFPGLAHSGRPYGRESEGALGWSAY